MLRTPFFNKIRTDQQLGYVASAFSRSFHDQPGLTFLLQSPVMGPDKLKTRVDAFAENQLSMLQELTVEKLNDYKAAVTVDLLKKDTNLSERTNRLWSSIKDSDHGFDEAILLADAVNAVSREQLIETYTRLVLSEEASPLFISNYGKAHQDEDYQNSLKDQTACKDSRCFDNLPQG